MPRSCLPSPRARRAPGRPRSFSRKVRAVGQRTGRRSPRRLRAAGRDWPLVRALLMSYNLAVEAVIEEDAEWAAGRWRRAEGLSLADRLCLALGERLDVDVWTADTSWGSAGRVRQLR